MTWLRSAAFSLALLLAAPAALAAGAEKAEMTVYKSPTCGCCVKWVEHLEANGFAVKSIDVADMSVVKREAGVAPHLEACHTGRIEGYVIEGHVPASDVARLLEERPDVKGLTVPGMPTGSPGMEGPGAKGYATFSFDEQGKTEVFSTHAP